MPCGGSILPSRGEKKEAMPCLGGQRHLLPIESCQTELKDPLSIACLDMVADTSGKNNFIKYVKFKVVMRHPRFHRNLNLIRQSRLGDMDGIGAQKVS